MRRSIFEECLPWAELRGHNARRHHSSLRLASHLHDGDHRLAILLLVIVGFFTIFAFKFLVFIVLPFALLIWLFPKLTRDDPRL